MKSLISYIALGLVSTQLPWVSLVFLYVVFIQWFVKNKKLFEVNALLGIVQICGLEFWGRLTNMDPYFPYEISKYLLFIYLIFFIGFSNGKIKTSPIILSVVVLGYSVVYFFYGVNISRIMSDSNGLVIILLAFSVLGNDRMRISTKQIQDLARNWLNYLIIGLVFVFIKTPDLDNINFSLGANYEASGGESSNQVSTYLGFGAILMFFFIISKQTFSGFKVLDILILIAFLTQSLLTFSRGGFSVALLLILYFTIKSGTVRFSIDRMSILTTVFILILTSFVFIDSKTNGMLSNRYKGETNATVIGKKDKNLNVITSNRLQIIEQNVILFTSNPFGVGPSMGTQVRKERFGTDYFDHTEPSRWIVEYGVLGILLIIIYFYFNLNYIKFTPPVNGPRFFSFFLVAMFFVSSLTMLHSGTRTFVSFLPMVLGFTKLKPNVAAVYRGSKSPQKA